MKFSITEKTASHVVRFFPFLKVDIFSFYIKMKRTVILSLILIFCSCFFAQKKSDAEFYYNNGEFEKSATVYQSLLRKKSKDALLNYCYAKCLMELNDSNYLFYFNKASEYGFQKADLFLAEYHFSKYNFSEAANFYSRLQTNQNSQEEQLNYEEKIAQCNAANELMSRVEKVEIIDSIRVKKDLFLGSYNLPTEAGELKMRSSDSDAVQYVSERKDKTIYAERKDEKYELMCSYKLTEGWSAPSVISKNICAESNKNFPFLMSDGLTLYFASDSKEGIGGYDIYMTRFSSMTNDYLAAKNVGMPFNSPFNDYMMAIDEYNKIGWFATDRYQSSDSVVIYKFVFSEEKSFWKNLDNEELALYAQLRKYNRAKKTILNQSEKKQQSVKETLFYINDVISYTMIDDFESDIAREKYKVFQQKKQEKLSLESSLCEMRGSYNFITKEEDKLLLERTILKEEKRIIQLQKELKQLEIEIRNLEISAWKK